MEMIFAFVILMNVIFGRGFDMSDKINNMLGTMSQNIINKYFMDSRCLGIVTEDGGKIMDFLFPLNLPILHVHIPLDTLKTSQRLDSEFEEYIWEEPLLEPINEGCLAFIVQTSELKSMISVFPRLFHSPKSVYRSNRKYLFLPIGEEVMTNYTFEETIMEIFSLREMDFMPDIVIAKLLVENNIPIRAMNSADVSTVEEDIFVELITQRFVGKTTKSDRVSLDIWDPNIGFLYGRNLYPDKISNLMGKKLRVAGIAYEPLTVIDWDADPSTYDGSDLQFMFQFAKKLNFTYEFVHDDYYYGEIWRNGSGNGALGLTAMDLADYVFCAACLWEYEHRFVDFSSQNPGAVKTIMAGSTAYYDSSVVLVVPKPKLLPGWMVPVLPFHYNMWISVAVSVLICTSLLYVTSSASTRILANETGKAVVNMYSSLIECAFRTTGLLVLQVPPDERDWSTPRFVPMRHLVTWLILFYFVVTTAYCGGLATVLTVPRHEKPIETVSDLASHNTKWTGIYDAYLVSIKESINPDIQKVVKNWRFGDSDWMEAKTTTGDMSFALEKMLGGHFFIPPFIQEDTMDYLRIMKEDLYHCTCVYVMRKGSPYMKSLNSLLMRARDAGLYYYWESYVGAFYMLAYGLLLACTVFILELLYFKFNTTNKEVMPKILINNRPTTNRLSP